MTDEELKRRKSEIQQEEPKKTNDEAKEARRSEFGRLIPLAKTGDRHAWDKFARLCEPIILDMARRWGAKPHDAEDIKQRILEDLLEGKLERYQLGNFEAWLRVLTKNETLNLVRYEGVRGKHKPQEALSDTVPGPEETLIEAQLERFSRKELNDMLAFLLRKKPAWAKMFELHYVEGLSHIEVANKLGVPKNTVHTSLARARVAIQEEFGIDLLEALGKTHLKRAA